MGTQLVKYICAVVRVKNIQWDRLAVRIDNNVLPFPGSHVKILGYNDNTMISQFFYNSAFERKDSRCGTPLDKTIPSVDLQKCINIQKCVTYLKISCIVIIVEKDDRSKRKKIHHPNQQQQQRVLNVLSKSSYANVQYPKNPVGLARDQNRKTKHSTKLAQLVTGKRKKRKEVMTK